jgi:hypothetical protein
MKERVMRSISSRKLPAHAALLVALALGTPAIAQSPPELAPPPGAPQDATPPSESTTPPVVPGKPDEKPLSEELKENEGVLEAPKALDQGIVREAPVPEPNTTPVIPPPGSPGGDPNPQPK